MKKKRESNPFNVKLSLSPKKETLISNFSESFVEKKKNSSVLLKNAFGLSFCRKAFVQCLFPLHSCKNNAAVQKIKRNKTPTFCDKFDKGC
jgi:hypothetical protein